jgi:hypothetical protein
MKKTLKILGLVICLVLLFKGWIYRYTVTYREIGQRQVIALQDSGVIANIQKQRNHRTLSVAEIVETSRSETNARLRFTPARLPQIRTWPPVSARLTVSGIPHCSVRLQISCQMNSVAIPRFGQDT